MLSRPSSGIALWRYILLFTPISFVPAASGWAAEPASDAAAPELLSDELLAEGWLQLFDGQTLFGWQATSDANWRVEEGEIRVDAGRPGWLMTTVDWADYELHVEFKAPATTNSGVFLRSALEPNDPKVDCIEVNIAPPENRFPTGWIVARPDSSTRIANARHPFTHSPENRGWHSFSLIVRGDKVLVALNERMVWGLSNAAPRLGRIGLQFNEGEVAFRNIRLRPLGLTAMLNGKDVRGWNTDEARDSEFSITDAGELRILDGPGQLESRATYGDFVMQLECFVDGDALNSGVFFRCIPRDYANGYESQIQNAMVDGDPTQPVDCGTGGIYRRVDARRIVSRDREWFRKTIVATGANIAVWVNGYPVTAWTDERAADPNPRRGLRTEPGTIALQGHDPTTDIRFRNMQIAELPPKGDDE